jgi:hypothetical protein
VVAASDALGKGGAWVNSGFPDRLRARYYRQKEGPERHGCAPAQVWERFIGQETDGARNRPKPAHTDSANENYSQMQVPIACEAKICPKGNEAFFR